jgi:hypothetical protein
MEWGGYAELVRAKIATPTTTATNKIIFRADRTPAMYRRYLTSLLLVTDAAPDHSVSDGAPVVPLAARSDGALAHAARAQPSSAKNGKPLLVAPDDRLAGHEPYKTWMHMLCPFRPRVRRCGIDKAASWLGIRPNMMKCFCSVEFRGEECLTEMRRPFVTKYFSHLLRCSSSRLRHVYRLGAPEGFACAEPSFVLVRIDVMKNGCANGPWSTV